MAENEVVQDQPTLGAPPEDFREFEAWRESGGGGNDEEEKEVPAVGEKQPPSEPSEEDDQTAAESETEEEPEQEEEEGEQEEEKPKRGEPAKGLATRMRKLTGEIKTLKARLAELDQPDAEAQAEEEVVSSPETEDEPEPAKEPAKLVRPQLRDFEDTGDKSAWDQYEEALDAYNDAKTTQRLNTALDEQRQALELEHAEATAKAEWNKASLRFDDYNEVVRADVKVSQAMIAVMRMDPITGTELAYYLGKHPEESEALAKETMADDVKAWNGAIARAAMKLGAISAKLTPPGKPKVEERKPVGPPTPQPPTPKKVTSASKPPAQIKGTAPPPKTDVYSDADATDYKKWLQAREAQLKRK